MNYLPLLSSRPGSRLWAHNGALSAVSIQASPLSWYRAASIRRFREGRAHYVTPTPCLQRGKSGSKSKSGTGTPSRVKFQKSLLSRFETIKPSSRPWREVSPFMVPFGIKGGKGLETQEKLFQAELVNSLAKVPKGHVLPVAENPNSKIDAHLLESMRTSFIRGDHQKLASELEYLFKTFLIRNIFPVAVTEAQKKLADMRYPWEWYPATRGLSRTIHLHVGPTNSGKTYHALKALENAKTGMYCGPLRLLAHEVYTRLEAKGKRCALVTGEERRVPEDTNNYYTSCTIEMAQLNKIVDVAVIDEIQMIADEARGGFWTGALLGVQAKEVHLCGEDRAVPLVQSICASIGDKCVVHRYKRLTPLMAADSAVGTDYRTLKKGDCIVCFSRIALHTMKVNVEKKTGKRCAIIYGGLPPEVRSQQADLFNEPDNDYDFLVASDAVGMGLNLEIKRVIFESVYKHDGTGLRGLTISEVRQIGGRAGRYRTARSDADKGAGPQAEAEAEDPIGIVSTLDKGDLKLVQDTLWKEPPNVVKAALNPPPAFVERISRTLPPNTPLSFLLLRMRELATLSDRFTFAWANHHLIAADAIQEFDLSIYDRLTIISAPCDFRAHGGLATFRALARAISTRQGGHLLDMPEIPLELIDVNQDTIPLKRGPEYLQRLEAMNKSLVMYLWMSYRYPTVFPSQAMAFHVRAMVLERINTFLQEINFADEELQKRRGVLRRIAQQIAQREEKLKKEDEEDEEDEEGEEGEEGEEVEESGKGGVRDGGHEGQETGKIPNEGLGRWNEPGHEEPLAQSPDEIEDLMGEGKRKEGHSDSG